MKQVNQITVGDITIAGQGSIVGIRKEIICLLKEKRIRNYLGIYKKSKVIIPKYIE